MGLDTDIHKGHHLHHTIITATPHPHIHHMRSHLCMATPPSSHHISINSHHLSPACRTTSRDRQSSSATRLPTRVTKHRSVADQPQGVAEVTSPTFHGRLATA